MGRRFAQPGLGDALERRRIGSPAGGGGYFAYGQPEESAGLDQGLITTALPWLMLGGFSGEGQSFPACQRREMLRTPASGILIIDANENEVITVKAQPRAISRLTWSDLARPLNDVALPALATLRRAVGGESSMPLRRHE
ncbi:hypothetical protein DFAR_2360008 [Desulfarculales bacterium]